VFSTTLERVEGNATLARDGVIDAVGLELLESPTFGGRVVYLRYGRA